MVVGRKCERSPGRVQALLAEAALRVSTGEINTPDRAKSGGEKGLAIARDGPGILGIICHRSCQRADGADELSSCGVPDPEGVVLAVRDDRLAVGGDLHPFDTSGMT